MAASKEVIAERLRALQAEHALTNQKASDRIGVDPRTYSRWIASDDPTIPGPDSIDKIARAYRVDTLAIIGEPNGTSPLDRRLERIELLVRKLAREAGLDPDEALEDEAARIADDAGRERPPGQSGTARTA